MVVTSPQRLALLKTILANPDDDLPRLVFADWLEENGVTDADVARAEFIRLGCKSKAKSRMTPAEGWWLTRNWRRLLPASMVVLPDETKRPSGSRQGRFLKVAFRWMAADRYRLSQVKLEYSRGFAHWAEYSTGQGYQRVWRSIAADEPLAYHRPEFRPEATWTADGTRVMVTVDEWGEDVYHRLYGDEESHSPEFKLFGPISDPQQYAGADPVVVAAEQGLNTAQKVARASLAMTMTAFAREFVGLADSCEKG